MSIFHNEIFAWVPHSIRRTHQRLSFDILNAARNPAMRALPLSALLIALMLSACASRATVPPSKHIAQDGPLRVNSELIRQPTTQGQKNAAPAGADKAAAEVPKKAD
jgi:hypothetical protein